MHCQGVAIGILLGGMIPCASAQWLNYPDPKTPRTKGGKPNLSASAPRSHGKPDLSGVWQTEASPPEEMARLFPELGVIFLLGDDPRTFSKYERNVLADFKPEEARSGPKQRRCSRRAREIREKIFQPPIANPRGSQSQKGSGILLPKKSSKCRDWSWCCMKSTAGIARFTPMAANNSQILSRRGWDTPWADGKPRALVVDPVGFNDKTWLDTSGNPHSEALHLIERFHRLDFGHMDLQITIEDPKMYTRPFTIKYPQRLLPDTDVLEFVCTENEKDRGHLDGR